METNQVDDIVLSTYKGIIALNNIGVTLLERACYRQAMTVFKSAIHLMKNIFGDEHIQEHQSDLRDTERHLQLAHKVLASSLLHGSTSYPQKIAGFEICFGDMNFTAMKSLLQQNAKSSVGVPLRIGDMCVQEIYLGQDTDLETAILMYNMGLSYQFAADEATDPSSICDMLSGCRRLFQFAASILLARSEVCCGGIDLLCVLFASSLVLANLSYINEAPSDWMPHDCSLSKEAQTNLFKAREATSKLLDDLNGMLGTSLQKHTAAAA